MRQSGACKSESLYLRSMCPSVRWSTDRPTQECRRCFPCIDSAAASSCTSSKIPKIEHALHLPLNVPVDVRIAVDSHARSSTVGSPAARASCRFIPRDVLVVTDRLGFVVAAIADEFTASRANGDVQNSSHLELLFAIVRVKSSMDSYRSAGLHFPNPAALRSFIIRRFAAQG